MTATDLIEQLQLAIKDGIITGDTEVIYASQPAYPFENAIQDEILFIGEYVYLAEEHQMGYLPETVRVKLRW